MMDEARGATAPTDALTDPATDPAADRIVARLVAAGITAGTILEPAAPDPRQDGDGTAAPLSAAPRAAPHISMAWPPSPCPSSRPPSSRSPSLRAASPLPTGERAGEGLRLMPLAGFHWGGPAGAPAAPPRPRVRGDHVLLRPTGGQVTIVFPRHNHPLPAGRLAFIPAGTAFSLRPPAETRGLALLIPPGCCRGLALPPGFRHGLPRAEDALLIDPAMQGLAAGMAGDPAPEAVRASRLGLIAVALSRLEDRPGTPDAATGRPAGARSLTEAFLQLARAELHRNQTIAEIARKLGCSLAQLDRACRASRGRSALDLLYDLRLQHATQALRDGNRPVAEIAAGLGYAGLGHFMRAFLAATGRTPEAYRALMRTTSRPDR